MIRRAIRTTLIVFVVLGVFLAGMLLHEVGHMLFLWANGRDAVLNYGFIYAAGFETFYIVGDTAGLDIAMLAMSGGFFAGAIILFIGLRFKWLLWVGIYHLSIGLFEYTGIGPFERVLLDIVFILGLLSSVVLAWRHV